MLRTGGHFLWFFGSESTILDVTVRMAQDIGGVENFKEMVRKDSQHNQTGKSRLVQGNREKQVCTAK